MPTSEQLHGTSARIAELMGKPHIGAHYEREDYRSHALDEGARCVVCGRAAVDAHHVVPRGQASGFTVNTPLGRFVVLSPLIALCRRCHDGMPSGYKLDRPRYELCWVWKSEQYEQEWWSGHTLAHICRPHDGFLWQEGHYLLTDKVTGQERVLTC